MIDKARDYFIMADQYLETSKLLLETMINSGNSNFGIGKSKSEAESEMFKNTIKSDSTLFLPALFTCYQGMELFIKGLLSLNNIAFKNIHELSQMILELKNVYGANNEIYKEFNNFYKYQIEIVKKYNKTNNITTTKELYESLRYPENKGKSYYYFDLKYNSDYGIKMFSELIKKINIIKNIVLKEFNKYR